MVHKAVSLRGESLFSGSQALITVAPVSPAPCGGPEASGPGQEQSEFRIPA